MSLEIRRISHRLASFSLSLMLLGSAMIAGAAETPTSLEGATSVSAEQAKKLADAGAQVIDVRVANEYADAHVKGAISVPYHEKSAKAADFDPKADSFDLAKLPADKNAPIIIYCNGLECWKSYKASKSAIAAGWHKVYWLRGGFPEWKSQGYPVE
jgi:rhodanese-related sulfurtransferase